MGLEGKGWNGLEERWEGVRQPLEVRALPTEGGRREERTESPADVGVSEGGEGSL